MILRILAIVVTAMAVNIYLPIAPSILGAWVDYQGLSMDVAGRMTSYDFWGATGGTVLAVFILHRPGWNLRATMLGCMLLVIVTSGASVWFAHDLDALAMVRLLNGIGTGLGYTCACVAVIGTPRIERTYAVLYGTPFVISGVGMALLPRLYASIGIDGAFYLMGAVNIAALVFLPFFPRTIDGAAPRSAGKVAAISTGARVLTGLTLAGLVIHYLFNSGIWAYFDRLGVAAGMTAERAGTILGPGMAASIVGMIAASVLGDRWGYLRPIYLGVAAIVASTLALLGTPSELVFGVGTALFNASISFVAPYMVAMLAVLVPSGMGVTAANIGMVTGFAAGPFLISFLVADGDFTSALIVTAAGFVVSGILFLLYRQRLVREPGLDRLKSLCLGSPSDPLRA